MKKTVAVFIIFYILAMGVMVGWGFIDKQIKENSQPESSQSETKPATKEQTTSPVTVQNTYTLWDLSNHKSQRDCWLAINGNVYDVTKYLDMHPGGADLILMNCGKDATAAFNTQGGRGGGHSSKAKALLEQYLVGKLN